MGTTSGPPMVIGAAEETLIGVALLTRLVPEGGVN